MKLKKYWFVPKKYGYGARPVTLEGWLLVLIFAIFLYLIITIFDSRRFLFYLLISILIFLVTYISKIKTRGKWKWRWN